MNLEVVNPEGLNSKVLNSEVLNREILNSAGRIRKEMRENYKTEEEELENGVGRITQRGRKN